MNLSPQTQRELLKTVTWLYFYNGPRGPGVVPIAKFAAMSRKEVNRWDFPERHRMHRIAKLLAKARKEMGEP